MRSDVMATIHTLRFLRKRLHNYERSRRFISLDTNIRTLSRIARNADLQRACPAKSARMIFISASMCVRVHACNESGGFSELNET